MDLNNIDLPASTLAELYRSSLVLPVDKSPEKVITPVERPTLDTPEWKWLGSNKKNVLVLVRYADALYLPANDLELLTSILTACKLSLEDVAILNLYHYPDFDHAQAARALKPARILLFGIEPAGIGLPKNLPSFQIETIQQTSYLSSPEIASLREDRNLKTNLWNSLKRLFGI